MPRDEARTHLERELEWRVMARERPEVLEHPATPQEREMRARKRNVRRARVHRAAQRAVRGMPWQPTLHGTASLNRARS
jgi:hypothetical protein